MNKKNIFQMNVIFLNMFWNFQIKWKINKLYKIKSSN